MHRHNPTSLGSCQVHRVLNMKRTNSFQQSTSLEDMMKKLLDDQYRFHEELQQFSCKFPSLHNLETQFIQVNATLQNMIDEKELCNTQPISYSEENVNVDRLKNVEVNETLQGVEMKEHLQIIYTADTFVLVDHDMTDSFVLKVPNELPSPNEGVHILLPKAIDAPFVVDILKGKGIT
ncbi:hypothetical protein Scep_007857 [Stephania cephalantha]|uniref:Uncharacterized protein n=1 Tax=Stephania cephalantha TaxID=152367 RepID=A0AAP0KDA6_9MAGN